MSKKIIIVLTILLLAQLPGRTQSTPVNVRKTGSSENIPRLPERSDVGPSANEPKVHSGSFALKNVHTGKYVRIKDANGANGTPIVAYSPVNWKCVTWEFQPTGKDGYTLKNLYSGKTLQPLHGEAKAGVAMEEQPLGSQLYEVIAAGNEQYLIRLKGSELYLTPADPGGATNSSIVLQAKQEGDLQRWTLVEQHPTM